MNKRVCAHTEGMLPLAQDAYSIHMALPLKEGRSDVDKMR